MTKKEKYIFAVALSAVVLYIGAHVAVALAKGWLTWPM